MYVASALNAISYLVIELLEFTIDKWHSKREISCRSERERERERENGGGVTEDWGTILESSNLKRKKT